MHPGSSWLAPTIGRGKLHLSTEDCVTASILLKRGKRGGYACTEELLEGSSPADLWWGGKCSFERSPWQGGLVHCPAQAPAPLQQRFWVCCSKILLLGLECALPPVLSWFIHQFSQNRYQSWANNDASFWLKKDRKSSNASFQHIFLKLHLAILI